MREREREREERERERERREGERERKKRSISQVIIEKNKTALKVGAHGKSALSV